MENGPRTVKKIIGRRIYEIPLDRSSEEGYTNNMTTTQTPLENSITLIRQAARDLVRRAIREGTVLVDSFTGEGGPYRLTILNGKVVACTCPDFVHRANYSCKHILAFESLIDESL